MQRSSRLCAVFTFIGIVALIAASIPSPARVNASPTECFVYVANVFDNIVSVINTSDNAVVETIAVGVAPYEVAIAPDGSKAYVTNYVGGDVAVIDTSDNTVAADIPVGLSPYGVAFAPDGTKAYIANLWDGDVSVINTSDNTIDTTIAVGDGPIGVAFTPDGSKAYIANFFDDTVSVIDTSDPTATLDPIAVGNGPYGVAVGCIGSPNTRSTTPKRTVRFDPAGGVCPGHPSTWTQRFRHSFPLPTDCTRRGHVFLGWTRGPADNSNLLSGRIRSSENLIAVWGELPTTPSNVTVLANFLCRQNCIAALIVWPTSNHASDTATITLDDADIDCTSQGEAFGLKWCWIKGLTPQAAHTASVAWRNQYGTGPGTTIGFSLA